MLKILLTLLTLISACECLDEPKKLSVKFKVIFWALVGVAGLCLLVLAVVTWNSFCRGFSDVKYLEQESAAFKNWVKHHPRKTDRDLDVEKRTTELYLPIRDGTSKTPLHTPMKYPAKRTNVLGSSQAVKISQSKRIVDGPLLYFSMREKVTDSAKVLDAEGNLDNSRLYHELDFSKQLEIVDPYFNEELYTTLQNCQSFRRI